MTDDFIIVSKEKHLLPAIETNLKIPGIPRGSYDDQCSPLFNTNTYIVL